MWAPSPFLSSLPDRYTDLHRLHARRDHQEGALPVSHTQPAASKPPSPPRPRRLDQADPCCRRPDRGADLQVRVTAPTTGPDLPIIVFSHGFGFSMDAYGPLVDFWAAHGFAVIQPTHLDSVTLGLAPDDPRTPPSGAFGSRTSFASLTSSITSRRQCPISPAGWPRPDRRGRALLRGHERQRLARRAHP